MTSENTNFAIAARLLLEKSDRNMEQAIRNADMGYWDLVATAYIMPCFTQ